MNNISKVFSAKYKVQNKSMPPHNLREIIQERWIMLVGLDIDTPIEQTNLSGT